MTQIIGYIATLVTLLAFTFRDIIKLRIFSCISCLLWIFYGYNRIDLPIILTNVLILSIHLYYFYKYYINKHANFYN